MTLDLTGLPPTPAEVEAFVGDTSPDAYEKLVDRLLASPRYGEHMTRFWLDLARYGDTHGLHLDNYREIWPYREWVIRAFNGNLPFDRFVTEQLAGDLLENPTLDQEIASGFNRCHVTTSEGGSIEEEVYCRNVFDRTETFAQVFLALTFTCARCHDHKFDPVTQKEYYGLWAFFNSLDGQELDGNKKDPSPVIKVPSPDQARELACLREAATKVESELGGPHAELDQAQAAWEKDLAGRLEHQWTPLDPEGFKVASDAALRQKADKSVQAGPASLEYEVTSRVTGENLQALLLEILPPRSRAPCGGLPRLHAFRDRGGLQRGEARTPDAGGSPDPRARPRQAGARMDGGRPKASLDRSCALQALRNEGRGGPPGAAHPPGGSHPSAGPAVPDLDRQRRRAPEGRPFGRAGPLVHARTFPRGRWERRLHDRVRAREGRRSRKKLRRPQVDPPG